MRITAVIAGRNEAPYLRELIPRLLADEISIVYIDNESTDQTREILAHYSHAGDIKVAELKYNGEFDLQAQLALKQRFVARLTTGWCIHMDADEMLHTPESRVSLRGGLEQAERDGCNAVNFDEFVMLPVWPDTLDYISGNTRYYFFQPSINRLMRAWRVDGKLTNVEAGGHFLHGSGMRLYPRNMILRDYIVRNQTHAYQKYLGRVFRDRQLLATSDRSSAESLHCDHRGDLLRYRAVSASASNMEASSIRR